MSNDISPFVKWAGGKKQLLGKLLERMPKSYNGYYEPFVGGGALFFEHQPKRAVINDVNPQLINVYRQLKHNVSTVISVINELDGQECNKEFYLSMREKYNQKISSKELDEECAALTIWINKHCFNGLYRVNSKGLFNVPYNNKKGGKSADVQNLLSINTYLNEYSVDILLGDFEVACSTVSKGDFVYFDSPYVPLSETAHFTDYSSEGFTYKDHVRLSELFKKLDKKGVKVMLSNHDVDLVHELYAGYQIETVSVKRLINSDATKRTGQEVIITNYDA